MNNNGGNGVEVHPYEETQEAGLWLVPGANAAADARRGRVSRALGGLQASPRRPLPTFRCVDPVFRRREARRAASIFREASQLRACAEHADLAGARLRSSVASPAGKPGIDPGALPAVGGPQAAGRREQRVRLRAGRGARDVVGTGARHPPAAAAPQSRAATLQSVAQLLPRRLPISGCVTTFKPLLNSILLNTNANSYSYSFPFPDFVAVAVESTQVRLLEPSGSSEELKPNLTFLKQRAIQVSDQYFSQEAQ